MDALLCISKNKASFIPIVKAWKSQDMFYYNFDCVWLRGKKSHIHLEWLECELKLGLFSFWGEL